MLSGRRKTRARVSGRPSPGAQARPGSAAVGLALAGLLAGCGREGNAREAPAQQTITLARENVAVVAERTLRSGPEISGTLRAKREASLRAEVGGTVLAVEAESGQKVEPGQLLARIDDAALQDGLLAARSGVGAAKNAVQVAEANARRARTLAEAGALAEQQAEQAEAALEGARAALADAQARLAVAGQQVGRTRVRAPFAGIVATRQVSTGDVVAPGTPLLTVIDPTRLQLEAAIPAARLAEVRPGAAVDFAVTGFGDDRFHGEIERVAPVVDAATGQVRVFVDVKNEGGRLISGLYAQGRVSSRTDTALAAPVAAVDTSSAPPTVLRVAGGKVERVTVRIGVRDEAAGAVAITDGVSAGDVLVLGSARATLPEGASVEVAGERASQARK